MRWVIAYDIPDDRRRARVARTLEGFGRRAQFSVFEARLEGLELDELTARLAKIIQPATDCVRFYPLCETCGGKVVELGAAAQEPFPDPLVYIA